jgi:hypothetical protein
LHNLRLRKLAGNKEGKPLSLVELDLIKEQDVLIESGKKKLEAIATHNKNNKQSLSAASNTPE